MVEDIILWKEIQERITHKISNADFKIMCELHAKYFNHKFEILCSCNKAKIRQWLFQLNDILK
jgi:hypothetical protein